MTYDLPEHRHRFAIWAAARAAQRGFTGATTKNLREAFQATDIRKVLSEPQTLELSADAFDALHRRWCSSICSSLTERGIAKASYGRAAKLVAIYLKATIIMSNSCDSSFGRNLHPPIDALLLKALASSNQINSTHKAAWRSIKWTQLDESAYYQLIGQLRNEIPYGAPFWTIEEYWEPSNSWDDVH